jgi:hypothetical protein
MPNLTKLQVDHAKDKIKKLASERRCAFIQGLGDEIEVPEFTDANKEVMIRNGTTRIDPKLDFQREFYRRTFLEFWEFPDTAEMTTAKTAAQAREAKIAAFDAEQAALVERLTDEIVMSPDGMTALAKIAAAFAN